MNGIELSECGDAQGRAGRAPAGRGPPEGTSARDAERLPRSLYPHPPPERRQSVVQDIFLGSCP